MMEFIRENRSRRSKILSGKAAGNPYLSPLNAMAKITSSPTKIHRILDHFAIEKRNMKITISKNNKSKLVFNSLMSLFVGYSCFSSMLWYNHFILVLHLERIIHVLL